MEDGEGREDGIEADGREDEGIVRGKSEEDGFME